MRIVIDAYQASDHITGTDRLAHNMLRELQEIDHENQYFILTNKKYSFVSSAVHADNFTVMPLETKKRAIWLMFFLPMQLLRLRAGAFFSFHNFGGPGIHTCYSVSSLLDTIPLSRPELYFGKDSKLRKFIVTNTMKRGIATANKIMAISEFTKQSAVQELGINPDKITVNYLQADPMFFNTYSDVELESARFKYNLPAQFVFTMGASEPRKNVAGLVRAFESLPEKIQQDFPLIIAGKKWHDRELSIDQNANIRLAGFIDDEDLPKVYQLATVFAFVSKYEGFGMPVLEAMASGTPVITSTTTSLPEVAGDAAVLVDPHDQDAIKLAMKSLLEDEDLRDSYTEKGKARVSDFSWRTAAEHLVAILKQK